MEGRVGGDLVGGDFEVGDLARGAFEGGEAFVGGEVFDWGEGDLLSWGEVLCDWGDSLAEEREALRAEGRGGEGGEGRERVREIFEGGEFGEILELGEGGVRGLQEVGGETWKNFFAKITMISLPGELEEPSDLAPIPDFIKI